MPDAVRPRWPPGEGGVERAWTQRGDRRGLPPRPPRPPHAAGGRGEGRSAARGRKEAEEARGRDKGRAAVERREAAAAAGAAGANSAPVDGGFAGYGWQEVAGSVASPKEVGTKRALLPPSAHPPPKRRAVSARPQFTPASMGEPDDDDVGGLRKESVQYAHLPPKARVASAERRFTPGCGRRLPSEAVPADAPVGVSKKKGPSSWGDFEVMNKSAASSSNVAVQSVAAQGPSKEHLIGESAPEIARMNKASSGTMLKSKIMYAPQKAAKPAKVIPISARDTQHGPSSKDKDKDIVFEGRVISNESEVNDELTAYLASQPRMPSDNRPMTKGKEDAALFGPRKKVKDPAHLPVKVVLGCKEKLDDSMVSSLKDDDILKDVAVRGGRLELHVNSSSGAPIMRSQREYRVQNADARSKVKMLCRRFEFICRALAQAVEQGLLKNMRIDLEAGKAVKKLPDFIKLGPIVGQVPGVEIGDEFLYRMQLSIVGLHRACRGGIDTTKDRNGVRVAVSIVASGGYPDELSSSGELIYTGSGGKSAGKKNDEDQKLERGNRALKNCIRTKTPVRVIHGFKGHNKKGGSRSRLRQIPTYTYDGLYHVVDCWREGQSGSRMFKYKLLRIPGQPELPLHIVKRFMKSEMRLGLCKADISQGKEGTPICVVNTVDDVLPAQFRYVTRVKKPLCLTQLSPQGCSCTSGCSDSASCACAVKNGGAIPFNCNGAIVNDKPLIFECGPSCTCPPSCYNRVSQHHMKLPLEVFRTTQTGWGVRSLRSITSGSFICEYVGELLHRKDADERRNRNYLFDIGHTYDDENLCEGLVSTVSGFDSPGSCSHTKEDVGFTIDAAEYGNIGRFINHSCSPNLFVQKVLWDHDDKRMAHIMFFAVETIPPLQELTYDYNSKIDHGPGANGRTNFRLCHCGSPQCCGWLY
ncbi:hypothetical protein ACP70R_000814 [Stipagrostis hirtigluma subsp. patula]